MLVVVVVVGATNFYIWQQRRAGVLRATATRWDLTPAEAVDDRIPAEQRFPVAMVVLHGVLALATLALTLAAAIDASAGPAAPRPRAATGPASSITSTSAAVLGTTGGARGPARFEFGATARGGRSVAAAPAGGDAVTAALTGLLPATLYHYRLVVGRAGGAGGADRTFVTAPPPRTVLAAASLRPSRFGRRGRATLRFALNAPATVRVVIARIVRPPRRAPVFVRRATLLLRADAGRNAVALGARPEVAALRTGPYRATLVAAAPRGRPSPPVRFEFTVR
jgi:hypothetical protein